MQPPDLTIKPSKPALKGEINSTLAALQDHDDSLDEPSKNTLMQQALSSNNEILQSRLMMLRDAEAKNGKSQAKLTEEIIKLAETYKVPELKFYEQASKQLDYEATTDPCHGSTNHNSPTRRHNNPL